MSSHLLTSEDCVHAIHDFEIMGSLYIIPSQILMFHQLFMLISILNCKSNRESEILINVHNASVKMT